MVIYNLILSFYVIILLIFYYHFSLYSGMFPMPRIVYTMACDGLLFKVFSKVLPKIQTPWVASLVTGIIGGNNNF